MRCVLPRPTLLPPVPTVTVLFFAIARERAGTSRETFIVSDGATARDVIDAVVAKHPAIHPLRPHLRVAVNEEFVPPEAPIPEGAQLALIPPVSGGSGAAQTCRITAEPLSLDQVVEAVRGHGFGGIVTFTGAVRDETKGKRVQKLEYEAYAPMAERTLQAIAHEAAGMWPGARVAIAHRIGTLVPGDLAVVIAAAAPHRDEAFCACRHAIERLKQDVPIWKREFFEDGVVWVGMGP